MKKPLPSFSDWYLSYTWIKHHRSYGCFIPLVRKTMVPTINAKERTCWKFLLSKSRCTRRQKTTKNSRLAIFCVYGLSASPSCIWWLAFNLITEKHSLTFKIGHSLYFFMSKDLYIQCLHVKSAIPHPRIMGVIRECGGKMHMGEGKFQYFPNILLLVLMLIKYNHPILRGMGQSTTGFFRVFQELWWSW